MNILVTRTTVWFCTARFTLPACCSPSPGPRQRVPRSLLRDAERLHQFAAFPVSVFSCRCKPCIWRQQWHEQELIWLSTSRAKATPNLEKSQQLSNESQNLDGVHCPGEFFKWEMLRQKRCTQTYTDVSQGGNVTLWLEICFYY